MSPKDKRTVRFIQVSTNIEKQNALCRIVMDSFTRKERTAVFVPSIEAASYVDQLLWNQPKEGFIPHSICQNPTDEPVAITVNPININNAHAILNLTSHALTESPATAQIFELLDLTSGSKESLSRSKLEAYAAAGFNITQTLIATFESVG